MDKPTINLNGKIIEMPTIKTRVWREIMKSEQECQKYKSIQEIVEHSEAVEKYCGVIACAFNLSADEMLDNLEIEEVLPTYFSVINYVVAMLTDKLASGNKKNADAAEN